MAEPFWAAVAAPLAAGTALSFFIERRLRPDPGFAPRPLAALAVHLGLWALVFCLAVAILQRPWFAAGLELAFLLLLVAVSNAKEDSTREPFIYQDFEYFSDALKHPRLFLPFLGVGRALLAGAAFALVFWGGITFEVSLASLAGAAGFWTGWLCLALLGGALLGAGAWRRLPLSFEPAEDLKRFGLLGSLWGYAIAERDPLRSFENPSGFSGRPASAMQERPHLVAVQSESFFDARRMHPAIRREVLSEFDSICSAAAGFGRLAVPARGGNTVRSEFAFLSGLSASQLGVHRFNPYRALDKLESRGVPSLASFLRNAGYRTVCVHPYDASFYRRERVFPALGFDEFVDVRAFSAARGFGPFVCDLAVAEKVREILDSSTQPTFVYAITMENHGPLHMERLAADEAKQFYTAAPAAAFNDLTVYLRHLRNADRMIGQLRECLSRQQTSGWLCWYGDHVPTMPEAYRAAGYDDGRTDYFIWGKDAGAAQPGDIAIENLASLLLKTAGLQS